MLFRFFEGLIPPFPSAEPTQPPTSLLKFCLHYCKGARPYLALMAALTALIAILEVMLFGFLGDLVDWFSLYSREDFLDQVKPQLFSMGLIVVVVLPAAVFLHSMIIHQTILGNFPMAIRWQAHRYLLGQSYSFYQDEFAGRIATKVMQTSLAVREAITKLLDIILYVSVYFTSVVFLVASNDLRFALPLVIWLAVYAVLLRYFLPRLSRVSERQADARSEMTGRIVDTYTNIATVKLFSHSKRESSYARESMEQFLNTVHPQMRLATQFSVSVWILNTVLILSMTSLSIQLWLNDSISTGAVAAGLGLILRLHGMSQWIMWEVSALFESLGTARDGMNTISQSRLVRDKNDADTLAVEKGEIKFSKVAFSYTNDDRVMDTFCLDINAGEKIGLVGRSGAGKSTLVNLLLRFHDIQAGAITIDGQNIKDITQESLRENIGVVTQDTSLLHRSIRENILYGNPKANEADLISAAKKASAHDFILSLDDGKGGTGYDAQVGERGVKLSGGQRQRIAIARVLLKNAPILILDEATSALDSEVETAIQENLYALMQGKTVIAIAHRLSTIARMDRLIVLDEGRIIQSGSHANLLKESGLYAQLWQHQSGGFIGD